MIDRHARKTLTLTLALACALALPVAAQAQEAPADMPGGVVAETLRGVSTVEKIDAKTREVTLKREDGSLVTVVAGEEVRNFDQIRVGDIVEVEVTEALAIAVAPAFTQVRERRDEYSGYRAKLGDKPGMKTTHTVEAVATVEAIDAKAREVTVKGAKQTVVLKAGEGVDLSTIKKGDNVSVVYEESVSIQVRAPGK
jgi:Cu/Ag efflux protein CusF